MVEAVEADGGEAVLAELELSRGLTVQLTVVGTMGLGVALAGFSLLYQVGTGQAPTFWFDLVGVAWWNVALNLLVLLALGTLVVVPHEWIHGLAIRHYGGEPRYGVGLAHFVFPYAYATTDHRFGRNQFVVVLLAPLVVVTAVGLPVMVALEWGWLVLPLAANAGGAVVDVWMALTLLGYPSHVDVEDRRDGVRILGRAGDRPRDAVVGAAVWDAVLGTAVVTIGLLVVLGVGGPIVLGALGVDSVVVGRPGSLTFVFAVVNTAEELSISMGFGVPVVGALVGLLYSLGRAYRRRGGTSAQAAD